MFIISPYRRFRNNGSALNADRVGHRNRISHTGTVRMRLNQATASSSTNTDGDVNEYECNDNELFFKFQNMIGQQTCLPEHPQQTTHFSDIPIELVLYIIRLVTCDKNDFEKCKTLDQLATVCRGWYVCARDHVIYRQACSKIWTDNEMNLCRYGENWRRMFLTRPVIHTSGCYVAHQNYTPRFHYLRFYSNGRFVYFKSKLTPDLITPILENVEKSRIKNVVRHGVYKLTNDKIIMMFNMLIDAKHWHVRLNNQDIFRQSQIFKFKIKRCGIRMTFCSNEYHKYLNERDNFFNFFSSYDYFSFT